MRGESERGGGGKAPALAAISCNDKVMQNLGRVKPEGSSRSFHREFRTKLGFAERVRRGDSEAGEIICQPVKDSC